MSNFFDDEHAETVNPEPEDHIRNIIKEMAGLNTENYSDAENGKPIPSIQPESVEKNKPIILEALDKLETQIQKRADHERNITFAQQLYTATNPETTADAVMRAIQNTRQILTGNPVFQEAPPREDTDAYKPKFLIDNWMPANRLTLLTGPGGTGKSYLALQYIAGLAMGITDYFLKPYHGTSEELFSENSHAFRKDSIKVVIASYEEDLSETWKRIAWICDWLGWADYETLTKQIRFVDLKMFGPMWGVGQDTHLATRAKLLDVGDWLLSECDLYGAELLMLDPSAGVYGANENARESVREFCSYLNGWGQQVNCATLLIAHPNKAGDDYSGNTDWLGSCRAMWTLRVEKENRGTKTKPEWHYWYQLTNAKQNYAESQRAIFLQKINNKQEKRWTPIWQRCSQSEAEEFFNEYHNRQSPSSTTQEDTHDDTDDDPYATAFLQ